MAKRGIHNIELQDGSIAQIDVRKSLEDGHDYYLGIDSDGKSGGVSYSSEEDAIKSLNDRNK